MIDKFVSELVNFITANQYVNLYSERFSRAEDAREELEQIHSKLTEEYDRFLLDIDINAFDGTENEEEEADIILKLINNELGKNGSKQSIPEAISIADALEKLSNRLDSRSLVIFHCFCDIHEEKEKDILRALRKFIEIYEKSPYLGILIISNTRTYNWELYPESRLDGRHVVFKEYP